MPAADNIISGYNLGRLDTQFFRRKFVNKWEVRGKLINVSIDVPRKAPREISRLFANHKPLACCCCCCSDFIFSYIYLIPCQYCGTCTEEASEQQPGSMIRNHVTFCRSINIDFWISHSSNFLPSSSKSLEPQEQQPAVVTECWLGSYPSINSECALVLSTNDWFPTAARVVVISKVSGCADSTTPFAVPNCLPDLIMRNILQEQPILNSYSHESQFIQGEEIITHPFSGIRMRNHPPVGVIAIRGRLLLWIILTPCWALAEGE